MTAPLYVIADIHGHMRQLDICLDLIERDGGPDAEIVFLGDLVDRGPDSNIVVQTLMDGVQTGRPWHVLKGNHDRMFSRFARDANEHDPAIKSGLSWLNPRLGGLMTLASYGVQIADNMAPKEAFASASTAVPVEHLDFLDQLPLYHETQGLLFVHAGIRPGVPMNQQIEDDLIWIREPFLTVESDHPWLIVHGHTALDCPHHFGNRIDLDGGAGYGRPLLPAVFEGSTCWMITEDGRKELKPGVAFQ